MQIDAVLKYHLGHRWILVSSSTIVADWNAPAGNQWIVPVGGGIGKIWLVAGKGIGFECQAFYNAVHPEDFPSADWTLRFQVQFIGSARR